MAARAPWRAALTHDERSCLLGLLHKITPPLSASEAPCPVEEVKGFLANAAAPPLASEPRQQRSGSPAREEAAI